MCDTIRKIQVADNCRTANTENNLGKYCVSDYVAWAFWKNKHSYNNPKITYIEKELSIQNNMLAVNNLSSFNIYSCIHQIWITYIYAIIIARVFQFYFLPQVSVWPWASYTDCFVPQSCPLKNSNEGTDWILRMKSFWCIQVML